MQQSLDERLHELLQDGMGTKAAAKVVSGELNVSRKEVYAAVLKLQSNMKSSEKTKQL